MKLWLSAFAMCQSMFCALPFPCRVWNEKARDKMLLFLPLVGLEIGLIWWGAVSLCDYWRIPQAIRAMVMAAVPYLLTGFLHLDGFMDVTDAVRSYRDLERRREILKDSRVGSFAVIGVVLVIVAQFAAAASLHSGLRMQVMVLIPAASRCCSVLAVELLPPMSTSQYASVEKKHILLPLLMLAGTLVWGFSMGARCGIMLVVGVAAYALALLRSYHSLKGMNGDIAGYCLTISELASLTALAILYQ